MSKIHIWIGVSAKSPEDFDKYFELDSSSATIDSPDYKVCQFCTDIEEKSYDDDFIAIYKTDDIVKLSIALDELPVDEEEYQKICRECEGLGYTEVNALFYYTDSELVIKDRAKKYNDLTYIGCFDSNL